MKKYLILNLSIIVIMAVLIISLLVQLNKTKATLSRLQHELDVSNKYIQFLTDRLTKEEDGEQPNRIDRLKDFLKEYKKEKTVIPNNENENIPDLIPLTGDYAISQRFSSDHPALDLASSEGTEVLAAATGEVLSVYRDKYFGNVIIIDHWNEYATLYAHLATAIKQPEAVVRKGDVIGLVGNTGFSSAPHLHFEILKKGNNIDPEKILKKD
jgi:Membrane proteins related to metalloendopeptidases